MELEINRLRSWLERIEEACAADGTSAKEQLIREAARKALRGQRLRVARAFPQCSA